MKKEQNLEDKNKTLHMGGVRRSHLRFWMITAYESGAKNHPQKVMKDLGITYQHATPQSIGDQWWFWNCENMPKELPEYLEVVDLNPMEMIGWGLSKEAAKAIRDCA